MTDVLVVSGERVWPPISGGRVRVAGIASALSEQLDVAVVEPEWEREQETGRVPERVRRLPVPVSVRPGSPAHFLTPRPRLGLDVLDRQGQARLSALIRELEPAAILYTQSYLAAVAPAAPLPTLVDFQNLELERLRSLAGEARGIHRASALWEAWKARRWEPRVARRATLSIAVSPHDAARLRAWKAETIVVPNALPGVRPCGPSPERGWVLFVGNVGYEPNARALEWLLRDVWPLVRKGDPQAELVVAGLGTERFEQDDSAGVRVAGRVDDLRPWYDGAAVAVAPVRAGGGTQLKVVEALAHGRVVVGSEYSARSAPEGARQGFVTAGGAQEFAAATVRLLVDAEDRHRREGGLASGLPRLGSWAEACRPLLDRLGSLR